MQMLKHNREIVPVSQDKISGMKIFPWNDFFNKLKILKWSRQQNKLLLVHQCKISTVVKSTVGNYAHQTQRQASKLRSTSCQDDDLKNSLHGENPNEALAIRFETSQNWAKYQ